MNLNWYAGALGRLVRADLEHTQHETLIISPYVSKAAIEYLLAPVDERVGITLVTALDLGAFVARSTDISAAIFVAERRAGEVRFLRNLHAKIFVRDWMSWWVGSANVTIPGLQINASGNLEVVGHFEGSNQELSRIVLDIVRNSRSASLPFLEELAQRVEEFDPPTRTPLSQLLPAEADIWEDLTSSRPSGFMMQELPLVRTPTAFIEAVSGGGELSERHWHDCFLLGVKTSDGPDVIHEKCAQAFRDIPLIVELDQFLTRPRRFGEIAAWLHEQCEDRPVPYRSEIKDLAARLIDWCQQLFPDMYRRERPFHSELVGRADADWSGIAAH